MPEPAVTNRSGLFVRKRPDVLPEGIEPAQAKTPPSPPEVPALPGAPVVPGEAPDDGESTTAVRRCTVPALPSEVVPVGRPGESVADEMKRFLRYREEDARRLRVFAAVAAPHLPRIAAEYCERVREHEDAYRTLGGEAELARLQGALVQTFARILTGPHDEAYYADRRRGMTVSKGVPQRYVIGGITLLRCALERVLAEAATTDGDAAATRAALARVLDLEVITSMEAYREDYDARLRRLSGEMPSPVAPGASPPAAQHARWCADAVELARALVVGADAQGRVRLFNAEAERVTGFARDQALGRRFVDLLLPPDARREISARLEAVRGGDASAGEWELPLCTRGGEVRVVRWRISAAADVRQGPDAIAVVAVGADVTGESARLANQVRDEKLAAVGMLATGIAHEFRNPLNGALLHLTVLERLLKQRACEDSDPALAAVSIASEEIRRLASLVTDYLVFARPEPLALAPWSVHELCRHALGSVGPLAGEHRVVLEAELMPPDVVLGVDRDKLERALVNLLRNAVEAAAERTGGTVWLRTLRRPHELHIEVEDNGIGLPAGAPVFDPFYTTKPDGTGLGLSMVARIVRDHGGRVETERRAGRTVFRVALPIVHPSAGDEP